MIEISINELLNSVQVLKKLSSQNFMAATAYKIARICRESDKELELFNNQRTALIQKYGMRDDSGMLMKNEEGFIQFSPENSQKFTNEINELTQTIIHLNVEKMTIEELGTVLLTPDEMLMIDCFIE